MGEHALKAGIGYAWLHEDVYSAATHPRVFLFFGKTYYHLGFAVGPGADPDSPFYGKYGYYYVRGNWNQPAYGGVWNIHANNYSGYHPGFLDDQEQADHQFRPPGREPVHPRHDGRHVVRGLYG